MPAVTLALAQPEDVPLLARVQRLAFEALALNRALFGQVTIDDRESYNAARLAKGLSDPTKALIKATLPPREEGGAEELVGFALWDLPKEYTAEGNEAEQRLKRSYPPGTNVELADEFFSRANFRMEGRHYHLSILVVDPRRQRTGAGTALMRWGMRKADEDRLPVDLKATDVGVHLYTRCGFSPYRDPLVAADGSFSLLPMSRPALSILPLSRSDIPQLPSIWFHAFRRARWVQHCFSRVTLADYTPWRIRQWEKALDEKEKTGEGEVWVAKRGNKVVGYAGWSRKTEKAGNVVASAEEEGKEQDLPAGADVERARAVLKLVETFEASIPYVHYSLDSLAITPEEQGTGLGKLLVRMLLDKADEEGVKVTLESTDIPFYERLGFTHLAPPLRVEDLPDVDLLYPMVYDPASRQV
ncbi:hypothetical protein JCM8097_000101 [Rhodosporidiobolus ruineniae]